VIKNRLWEVIELKNWWHNWFKSMILRNILLVPSDASASVMACVMMASILTQKFYKQDWRSNFKFSLSTYNPPFCFILCSYWDLGVWHGKITRETLSFDPLFFSVSAYCWFCWWACVCLWYKLLPVKLETMLIYFMSYPAIPCAFRFQLVLRLSLGYDILVLYK